MFDEKALTELTMTPVFCLHCHKGPRLLKTATAEEGY
jgi:glutaredoxin